MRVYCKECGSKALILSRDELTLSYTRLYCQCQDAKGCSHRFVMTLTYSHALESTAAVEAADCLLFDRLRSLPPQQQREIFEQLGLSST
jgi:hypothetical protein